jgi:predicted HD superfamily hydrolase involved in NAD metabolism
MNDPLGHYANNFRPTGDIRADMVAFLTERGFAVTAEHCLRVGSEARVLAERFGANLDSAEICGWLHDISAVIPNAERIAVAEALQLAILPEEHTAPMIVHQKLSAEMARALFHIDDPAILSAISCHTTLKAGATLLDKILFVADKIAWDQFGDPPYLADILSAAGQSIDAATAVYLDYLWQRRAEILVIHPWFEAAYREMQSSNLTV